MPSIYSLGPQPFAEYCKFVTGKEKKNSIVVLVVGRVKLFVELWAPTYAILPVFGLRYLPEPLFNGMGLNFMLRS